ncbi:DJ-1/PfpI family protein [Arcobacter sp. YIC-464]|uniref:DJ-1/PfpI family protein n=1 Tax=Arcobacter sp. YIC-464 TaxID=3376631 RepID=UPI003C2080A3
MNIGIYIYENAEVLDFSGPFEVFSTASRFLNKKEKFNVFLVAQENKTVKARGGFNIFPHYCFADCPSLDVLIVVGGVHNDELEKQEVISWIKEKSKECKQIASVCTGAFLLAKAKVIKKQKVTTHHEDIEDLRKQFPKLEVVENIRFVEQNNIITSAGISAGIDMSLYLLSKLKDKKLANKTAKQMEYDWKTK